MLSSSANDGHGTPFAPQQCAVQPDWLSRRGTLVEQRVDRLEIEIDSVRSAVHTRWGVVDARFAAMQAQIDARFDAVEQVLISLQSQIVDTQKEMARLHHDTARHMRVLHEDVVERISRIKG
jgi:hypothetical protein